MENALLNSPGVSFWSAVCVVNGSIRRMMFEAAGEAEARAFAIRCGAGLEGEARRPKDAPPPSAYDEKTARVLLGNISPSTLYRELAVGNLRRVPGLRKILVTRESIEAWPMRRH